MPATEQHARPTLQRLTIAGPTVELVSMSTVGTTSYFRAPVDTLLAYAVETDFGGGRGLTLVFERSTQALRLPDTPEATAAIDALALIWGGAT